MPSIRNTIHLKGFPTITYNDHCSSYSFLSFALSLPPSLSPSFSLHLSLPFSQISQAQYQNGVMSSRLDSIPQSPDFGQPRLEGTTSPVLTTTPGKLSSDTPNPTPTPETASLLADETTSLLNEQDCLPHNLSETSI